MCDPGPQMHPLRALGPAAALPLSKKGKYHAQRSAHPDAHRQRGALLRTQPLLGGQKGVTSADFGAANQSAVSLLGPRG